MTALRYFASIGNVAVSLLIGLAAFAVTFIYYPEAINRMLREAVYFKEYILSLISNPHYQVVTRVVLHEHSIVLMGFTMASRVVMGLVGGGLSLITRR